MACCTKDDHVGHEHTKRLKLKRREEEGRESFLSHKVETFLISIAKLEPRLEAMELLLLTESSLRKFVDFLQSCGGAYNNYLSFWIEAANVNDENLTDEQVFTIAKSVFASYVPLKAPLYILLSAVYKDKLYKALGLKKVFGQGGQGYGHGHGNKDDKEKTSHSHSPEHTTNSNEKSERERSVRSRDEERSVDRSVTPGRRPSNSSAVRAPPVVINARNINYTTYSTRLPPYLQQVSSHVLVREDIVTVFKLVRGEVLKAFADTTYEKFFTNRCYTLWRSQKRAQIYAFVWNHVVKYSKAFNYNYITADVRVGDRKNYQLSLGENGKYDDHDSNGILYGCG